MSNNTHKKGRDMPERVAADVIMSSNGSDQTINCIRWSEAHLGTWFGFLATFNDKFTTAKHSQELVKIQGTIAVDVQTINVNEFETTNVNEFDWLLFILISRRDFVLQNSGEGYRVYL